MTDQDYDYVQKIIFIGDVDVGKTSILYRYLDNTFKQNTNDLNIGVDYRFTFAQHKEKKSMLQLWDTAGEERFRILAPNYYKGVNTIFLVFDATREATFVNMHQWLKELYRNCPAHVPIYVIANKIDSEGEQIRQVLHHEGVAFVKDKNLKGYFEVSAKTGMNIDALFKFVSHAFIENKIEEELQHQREQQREQAYIQPTSSCVPNCLIL